VTGVRPLFLDWLDGVVERDPDGYVITGDSLATSVPGVCSRPATCGRARSSG
jgi:alkyl hydroperoxide reductase subunit AhpF